MIELDKIEEGWTARIELPNRQEMTIWWTAWPMLKRFNPKILWVASDWPRYFQKDTVTGKI